MPYRACALESCVNLLRRRPHVATSSYIPPYWSSQFDRTPNLLGFPPACCAPLAPPPPWPHVSSSRRGSPAESRASTPPPASRARPPPGGYSCSHMAVPHTRLGSAAPDHTPSMAGSDHSDCGHETCALCRDGVSSASSRRRADGPQCSVEFVCGRRWCTWRPPRQMAVGFLS